MGDDGNSAEHATKRCFVVSAFGATPEARKRTQQVLTHLVRKVLEPRGYRVIRADEIHAPGLITHQIIEHLLDVDLVVADLTGNNPNVFYEIAVRHAARRPIVHLLTDGHEIPFDLKDVRTVFYALDDPDRLVAAQREFEEKVAAIEGKEDDATNPVAAVRDLRLLQSSDNPETRDVGQILGAISEMRDEIRSLAMPSQMLSEPRWAEFGAVGEPTRPTGEKRSMAVLVERRIVNVLKGSSAPKSLDSIAHAVGFSPEFVAATLQHLQARGEVYETDDGFSSGPL